MQKEINASHILINVAPDADPKDTLAAYNKISRSPQAHSSRRRFWQISPTTYSEDPSAKENNGNLGYFTALQMVYPFEDAAYNTPAGQLSNPIRTRFGYHLIKVNDVRQAQGEIKVVAYYGAGHPGYAQSRFGSRQEKNRRNLCPGTRKENWDKLVAQFSEDVSSSENGGELPWFGTGRMIAEFWRSCF